MKKMTPGDILNKTFPRSMSGYKADEVNSFLSEVASEFRALSQERSELQSKLEVLAEKLEEYRNDEESLRAALIGAQKLGDGVVKEARKKAETILAEANRKAEGLVSEAKRSIDAESYALSKMRLEVAKFRTQVLNLYKKQVELINSIPHEESDAAAILPASSATPDAGGADIQPPPPAGEIKLEYERASDEGEPSAAQRQSKFGNLRFGEKYDLKRDE